MKPALQCEDIEYCFYNEYFRGQAFLLLNNGTRAVAEFQKILDNRGQDPFSPVASLAHLGIARAAKLSGELRKSKKAYEDFLTIMKNAES